METKSFLSRPGIMIGGQYKIKGIAQAETIRHKRDFWTLIVRRLRINKDNLGHLMKTVSIWGGQVMFEVKCRARYLTVCSLGIKQISNAFSLVYDVYGQDMIRFIRTYGIYLENWWGFQINVFKKIVLSEVYWYTLQFQWLNSTLGFKSWAVHQLLASIFD